MDQDLFEFILKEYNNTKKYNNVIVKVGIPKARMGERKAGARTSRASTKWFVSRGTCMHAGFSNLSRQDGWGKAKIPAVKAVSALLPRSPR